MLAVAAAVVVGCAACGASGPASEDVEACQQVRQSSDAMDEVARRVTQSSDVASMVDEFRSKRDAYLTVAGRTGPTVKDSQLQAALQNANTAGTAAALNPSQVNLGEYAVAVSGVKARCDAIGAKSP